MKGTSLGAFRGAFFPLHPGPARDFMALTSAGGYRACWSLSTSAQVNYKKVTIDITVQAEECQYFRAFSPKHGTGLAKWSQGKDLDVPGAESEAVGDVFSG